MLVNSIITFIVLLVLLYAPSITIYTVVEREKPVPVVLTVEEYIRYKATEAGVDPDLAVAIANAESRLYPQAKNPHSTAKGVFQILDGTWGWLQCPGDPLVAEDNIDCGIKLLAEHGSHHWDESKHVWLSTMKK